LCTLFLLERGIGHYLKPEFVEAPETAHQLVLLVVKSLTERKPKPSEVAAFIDDKCRGTRWTSTSEKRLYGQWSHTAWASDAGKVVVVVWVRHGDRPAVLQAIEKPAPSYAALEMWYTNYNELRLADTDRNEVARTQLAEALSSVGVLPADPRNGPQTPQREERSGWRKFSPF
jgi:hypothetical protein